MSGKETRFFRQGKRIIQEKSGFLSHTTEFEFTFLYQLNTLSELVHVC